MYKLFIRSYLFCRTESDGPERWRMPVTRQTSSYRRRICFGMWRVSQQSYVLIKPQRTNKISRKSPFAWDWSWRKKKSFQFNQNWASWFYRSTRRSAMLVTLKQESKLLLEISRVHFQTNVFVLSYLLPLVSIWRVLEIPTDRSFII